MIPFKNAKNLPLPIGKGDGVIDRSAGCYAILAVAFHFVSVLGQRRLYHDGTFKTFLFQSTGGLVRLSDISLILEIVCITAAGAIELCPAVTAVFLAVDICFRKIQLHVGVEGPVVQVAHFELFHSDELMAGINVALRSNCNIFVAATAAAQTLDRARSLVEIDHKVEEIVFVSLAA